MTTVIDPAGSPSIVYNRSGTVIVPVTANDDIQANATQIPNISGWQVAMVTVPSSGNNAIKMHPDADVGTIVEVYRQTGPEAVQVFPANSQTINGSGDPQTIGFFRKVAATDWRKLPG